MSTSNQQAPVPCLFGGDARHYEKPALLCESSGKDGMLGAKRVMRRSCLHLCVITCEPARSGQQVLSLGMPVKALKAEAMVQDTCMPIADDGGYSTER